MLYRYVGQFSVGSWGRASSSGAGFGGLGPSSVALLVVVRLTEHRARVDEACSLVVDEHVDVLNLVFPCCFDSLHYIHHLK